MTPQAQAKHNRAKRNAERAAAILTAFGRNPASVYHNLPVSVVERKQSRHIRGAGANETRRQVASKFSVVIDFYGEVFIF